MNAPQDYIANLEMVIKNYIRPMRQRVGELFVEESITIIFSNMEALHSHQSKFYEDLTEAAARDGRSAMPPRGLWLGERRWGTSASFRLVSRDAGHAGETESG